MKILFLCHAHPSLQAGGTEHIALDLFRTLRMRHGADGMFVAGAHAGQRAMAPGSALQGIDGAPDEALLWTGGFDAFFLSQTDTYGVAPALTDLLRTLRPDIVHVHHVLTLGVEVLPLIRRVVPSARIVLTLHDFYGLCAHDGQMVTTGGALCGAASLDACHACLPDRTLTDHRLRRLHVQRALAAVDQCLAPSRFLADRFMADGLCAAPVQVLRNGIPAGAAAPLRDNRDGRRDRFGFFGHINRFKGAATLLDASARLTRGRVSHGVALHGGAAHQLPATLAKFEAALAAAPDARYLGPYRRADVARLMAPVDWVVVPSLWWENAPLVIQEAFLHGRPVICGDIGGMAEAVRDETDGLLVPVNDPQALAEALARAADPGLHTRLREGIGAPFTIEQCADDHNELYRALLARPTAMERAA